MDRYDGFHEFVVARGGALSRTAFLLTGEHHAAEDLLQSALAKAAVRWRQILDHGQPEAYVRRTMINEQISWWRRRRPQPVAQVPDQVGPDEPHQVVERVALGQALDTLTPRQRAVVVLRYYEDLSEADTAEAMGCSVGTVKSQTHLALGHLRKALPLFAEQAGQYADAQAVLSRAGRSKARRATLVAALALVPIAVGITLYALRGPDTAPPPLTPPPSPSSSPAVVVPSRISSTVAELPTDRGVGPAALLLRRQWKFIEMDVVLPDGRRYHHKEPGIGWGVEISLSPDGRWLVIAKRDETLVRDLTGTTVRRLARTTGLAWSPSGAYLLTSYSMGRDPLTETVYSVPDWTPHPVPKLAWTGGVLAVLDTGEVVGLTGRPTGNVVAMEVVSPLTGARRPLTVDLSAMASADERPVVTADALDYAFQTRIGYLVPAADGSAGLMLRIGENHAHPGPSTALIRFSLSDGSLIRRYEVPGKGLADGGAMCFRGGDLLWSSMPSDDRTTVRVFRDGATADSVLLELDRQLGRQYYLAGCERPANLPDPPRALPTPTGRPVVVGR